MMLWGYGDAGWVMAVAMIMAVLLIALTVALCAPLVLRRSEPEIMFVATLVVCLFQVAAARPPIVADLAVMPRRAPASTAQDAKSVHVG